MDVYKVCMRLKEGLNWDLQDFKQLDDNSSVAKLN